MHSAGQNSWCKGASWDPSKRAWEASRSFKLMQAPSNLVLSAGHALETQYPGRAGVIRYPCKSFQFPVMGDFPAESY